ncbi:GNAT family N-acetyltransferase [Candidatus Bathyarchaeota archaeon]|nr:GNAT family N-acetyltransferase [Candidatus Bathyarchaeota archaeon]
MADVRPFREDDSERLAEIANEAFDDEIAHGMLRFSDEYFVKRTERAGVKLFVADVDCSANGFLLLTDANVEAPAQVHLVAVDKRYRGMGVGRRLMTEAVGYAKRSGAGKLKLSTRPWNHAMHALCASLGFTKEAYLRKEYLGEDLVQFALFF